MTTNHKPESTLAFATRAALGALGFLLLAAKSGEKFRGDLAARLGEGVNEVRGKGHDLKRKAQEIMASANDQVQDAVTEGRQAYGHAKKG